MKISMKEYWRRMAMTNDEWLLGTNRCKDCEVWASDRSCDCDVEEE